MAFLPSVISQNKDPACQFASNGVSDNAANVFQSKEGRILSVAVGWRRERKIVREE